MKSNITLFKLVAATIVVGVLPKAAFGGSIQIMAPSTSKIEVIGMKNTTSIKYMGVKKPARQKLAGQKSAGMNNPLMKPEIKAVKEIKTVTETKTAKIVPSIPKMRTGEVELPVIPVSHTESN